MPTSWPKLLLIFVLFTTGRIGLSADTTRNLASLERSFWLHASLAPTAQKNYWGPAYPASPSPTERDIQNAAKLLTGTYAANRLYLVYHAEIPVDDAGQVFGWWRQHCPHTVTLVPAAVADGAVEEAAGGERRRVDGRRDRWNAGVGPPAPPFSTWGMPVLWKPLLVTGVWMAVAGGRTLVTDSPC